MLRWAITLLLLSWAASAHAQTRVVWYKFDETSGTTITDTATGINATIQGGRNASNMTVAGHTGTALEFNGTTDYASFTQIALPPNYGYTFSAWIYLNSTAGIQQILGLAGGDSDRFRLNSGRLNAGNDATVTIPAGSWHHVAVTRNAAGAHKLYQDGVDVTGTVTTGAAQLLVDQIGRTFNGTLNRYFSGRIDDLMIFADELTPSQITAVYNGTFSAPATWKTTPAVACQDPAVWRTLFKGAYSAQRRIAIFGDSQETSPGGAGIVFLSRLNYEAYRTYGHIGETTIAPIWSYGDPNHGLFLRAAAQGAADTTPAVAADKALPAVPINLARYDAGDLGPLVMLQPRATTADSGTLLADTADFWNRSLNTTCEIFCYTLSGGSTGLSVLVIPTDTSGGNYFGTPTATIATGDIGLNAASGTPIKYTTPTLNWNNLKNMQVIIRPNGAGDIIVAAARYRNATARGVVFSDMAAGGYQATSFLGSHANAGPMLNTMGPWDAVWLMVGTNDAASGNGISASDFKANLLAFITALRGAGWLNDANLKIIISTDPFGVNATGPKKAHFARYAAVAAELANTIPNVLAINEYRLAYEQGLDENTYATYLSDGVHHNALGARNRATLFWDTFQSIGAPPHDQIYLIGNSLTNNTLLDELPGVKFYHIDCGTTIEYIYNNPLNPCAGPGAVGNSHARLWPVALVDSKFDFVSVQPFASETIDAAAAAIDAFVDAQPDSTIIVHSGWAHHTGIAAHWASTADTYIAYCEPSFNALMTRLRADNPGRKFRETHTFRIIHDIYTDCLAATAPFPNIEYIYKDDIHLTTGATDGSNGGAGSDGAGAYMAHNAMRRAMGLPYATPAACTATAAIRAYMRAKIEAYHGPPVITGSFR